MQRVLYLTNVWLPSSGKYVVIASSTVISLPMSFLKIVLIHNPAKELRYEQNQFYGKQLMVMISVCIVLFWDNTAFGRLALCDKSF